MSLITVYNELVVFFMVILSAVVDFSVIGPLTLTDQEASACVLVTLPVVKAIDLADPSIDMDTSSPTFKV